MSSNRLYSNIVSSFFRSLSSTTPDKSATDTLQSWIATLLILLANSTRSRRRSIVVPERVSINITSLSLSGRASCVPAIHWSPSLGLQAVWQLFSGLHVLTKTSKIQNASKKYQKQDKGKTEK